MIPADHQALYYAATRGAALCTIVGIDGSFSRRCGAQLAIGRDGTMAGDMADNCLNSELAAQSQLAMADRKVRLLRYGKGSPFVDFRLPCGSGLDILIDPRPDRQMLQRARDDLEARRPASLPLPLPPQASSPMAERRFMPALRLLVMGSGAECDALARLAEAQGIAMDWREAGKALHLGAVPAGLSADRWTAVLLLFHDHEWEHALLEWAVDMPCFYIGAQGGAPARTARLERLAASGRDAEQLDRIRSPIGLIPRARDPAVLALSVLADVVGAYEALHPHLS
ncbi:MAG: XdhC family protein [Blastomonas sp.]